MFHALPDLFPRSCDEVAVDLLCALAERVADLLPRLPALLLLLLARLSILEDAPDVIQCSGKSQNRSENRRPSRNADSPPRRELDAERLAQRLDDAVHRRSRELREFPRRNIPRHQIAAGERTALLQAVSREPLARLLHHIPNRHTASAALTLTHSDGTVADLNHLTHKGRVVQLFHFLVQRLRHLQECRIDLRICPAGKDLCLCLCLFQRGLCLLLRLGTFDLAENAAPQRGDLRLTVQGEPLYLALAVLRRIVDCTQLAPCNLLIPLVCCLILLGEIPRLHHRIFKCTERFQQTGGNAFCRHKGVQVLDECVVSALFEELLPQRALLFIAGHLVVFRREEAHIELLWGVGCNDLAHIVADDGLLRRGVTLRRTIHLVDDEHHAPAALLLDGELAEMRADLCVEPLACHDEDEERCLTDLSIRNIIVILAQPRMDAGRIDDLHAVPVERLRRPRRNAGTDRHVDAGEHLDDAGFARAVLSDKDELDRTVIGAHIVRQCIRRQLQRVECRPYSAEQRLGALCICVQYKVIHPHTSCASKIGVQKSCCARR